MHEVWISITPTAYLDLLWLYYLKCNYFWRHQAVYNTLGWKGGMFGSDESGKRYRDLPSHYWDWFVKFKKKKTETGSMNLVSAPPVQQVRSSAGESSSSSYCLCILFLWVLSMFLVLIIVIHTWTGLFRSKLGPRSTCHMVWSPPKLCICTLVDHNCADPFVRWIKDEKYPFKKSCAIKSAILANTLN